MIGQLLTLGLANGRVSNHRVHAELDPEQVAAGLARPCISTLKDYIMQNTCWYAQFALRGFA